MYVPTKEDVYTLLGKVRDGLASGRYVEGPANNNWDTFTLPEGAIGIFDMGDVEYDTMCGTAACIGGWMRFVAREEGLLSEKDYFDFDIKQFTHPLADNTGEQTWNDGLRGHDYVGLNSLFFNWGDLETPTDAIKAIDTFISGEYIENPWDALHNSEADPEEGST